MSLIRSLASVIRPPSQRASTSLISLDDYISQLTLGNLALRTTMTSNREEITDNYRGLAYGAYRSNGLVFACMLTRMQLFSEARFQFQQMRGGRPGDLFGTPALSLLEQPEPSKTTGDLITRAIAHYDLAGNAFLVRRPNRIKALQPDWVYIVRGTDREPDDTPSDPNDIDTELLGYVYKPGGIASSSEPVFLAREEVAHFAGTTPDPTAQYRGMSWLTPLIREVMADSATTLHKLKFFENAATPNLVVKFPVGVGVNDAQEWIETIEQDHAGALNAYRTLYLGQGADATAVGLTFEEMDFKATQGHGETRIVAAAGLHPSIVPVSEGLAGSALNEGNYEATARLVAGKTLRSGWRNLAGSLQTIVPPPPGSRLWYDDRDVAFLREDIKDAADVLAKEAQAIRTLWDGGGDPSSVIDAVTAGDLRRIRHSGYLSVQMQPARPTDTGEEPEEARWTQVHEPMARISLAPVTSGPLRARETFWPVDGPAEGLYVEQGSIIPADHYLARAFPQMFEASGPVIEGTSVRTAEGIRCAGCNRFLAEIATAPYRLRCRDCKAITEAA